MSPDSLSPDSLREIDAFLRRSGAMIRAFTVKDILEGELARKLASPDSPQGHGVNQQITLLTQTNIFG